MYHQADVLSLLLEEKEEEEEVMVLPRSKKCAGAKMREKRQNQVLPSDHVM